MSVQTKSKIVRQVEEVSNAVNDMHKAMEQTPSVQDEKKVRLTEFQKKFPDAKYIEPTYRFPTQGVKSAKYHEINGSLEYLTEYVVGIFESQIVGQTFSFDLGEIPGEDYCRWTIPTNKPIGLPRYVAKHLSKNLCWKEMKPLGKNQEPQAYNEEDITVPFTNFETKRRGTFHPINAY